MVKLMNGRKKNRLDELLEVEDSIFDKYYTKRPLNLQFSSDANELIEAVLKHIGWSQVRNKLEFLNSGENNTEINPATNAMASVALSVLQGEKGKELAFLVQDEFISKPNKYDGSIPHNLSSKETFAVDGALTSAAFHYIGISAEYMMLHAYRTCRNDFNNAYFEKSLYAEKKDEPNTFLNAAMVLGTHSLLAEYRRKRAGEMFKKIEDNIPTHEIVSEGKTVGCLFSNRFSKKFERAYVADNALMAINYLLLDRKKEAEMLLNGIERSAVKKRYEDGLQLYYPELDAEPDNQKIMALPNILLAIAYMAMKDREW